MARVSTKENKNIYQLTREGLKLMRDAASELLESIPPERIEKIENERSLPHPDEVLTMADKYKKPDLCNYYRANQCPIGQEYVPEIKIKDLCALACINKSTFYAHYEDIYALANALENKLIESILASVPRTNDSVALHQAETLTRELFHAFMQNQRAVNILFSGSRQGIFANSIEKGLRQRFEEADPTFAADLNRGILLSFCVQGCFYAFANNSSRMDESKLVELLGAIAKAAQSIEF